MALYRSYNKEQKLAIASIISVFNNITISRFDKDGNVKKDIRVPVKYAAENQIIKSLRDKNKVQSLPVITVERTSLERDVSRVVDLNRPFLFQGRLYSESQINNPNITEQQKHDRRLSYDFRRNPPQPMNIGFKVTFYSQYEEDLWQMQSNVIPFISPFVVVSSYHPYDKCQIIRTKILCDGKFSEEIEIEQPIEEFQIYKCSIDLNYLGYFWFGNEADKFSWDAPTKIEHVISGADNGPVGNINEGDLIKGNQYVDESTGNIYDGIYTGKNINDGDKPGEGEFVDPETGEIYRKDYHFAVGNIKDGFYITSPAQTVAEVDKLIDWANTHDELPYHEHIYVK